jgi:hypothetical protein
MKEVEMTDTSTTNSAPTKPTLWTRIKWANGLARHPKGRPPFIWMERANAWVYMLGIGIGVPALGYSDIDPITKMWLTIVWFGFVFQIYAFLEMREYIGQMQGRGSIDAPQASSQVTSAMLTLLGGVLALGAWIFGAYTNGSTSNPFRYGLVEWTLIGHTFGPLQVFNKMVNYTIMELLKATPRSERVQPN